MFLMIRLALQNRFHLNFDVFQGFVRAMGYDPASRTPSFARVVIPAMVRGDPIENQDYENQIDNRLQPYHRSGAGCVLIHRTGWPRPAILEITRHGSAIQGTENLRTGGLCLHGVQIAIRSEHKVAGARHGTLQSGL